MVTAHDSDGTILALGGRELLDERGRGDHLENLDGLFVTPGLWDSHVHLLDFGRSLRRLTFSSEANRAEVLSQVSQEGKRLPRGQWIIGGGWNRSMFEAPPDQSVLDAAAPDHPVLLMSWDYHTAWMNSQAAERLELDPRRVPGDRDDHGRWTGILREHEAFAAQERAMRQDDSPIVEDLARGMAEAARLGLTGVTAIEDRVGLMALQDLPDAQQVIRTQVFLREPHRPALLDLGIRAGFGTTRLRLMGIKWFLDGALGSGTAWMKEAYTDDDRAYGLGFGDEATLLEQAAELHEQQLLLAVHAIGDRAVSLASRVLSQGMTHRSDGRHSRIEHAQLLDDEDLAVLRGRAVALSMQPVHLLVDEPIAEQKWGASRSAHAFRFRDALNAGIPLLFGSDAPVANPDPRLGLWAAVYRAWPGKISWHPEQGLRADEAFDAYTRAPAAADGRPAGRIARGCWGDFTLWHQDPLAALIHKEFDGLSVAGTVTAGRRIG